MYLQQGSYLFHCLSFIHLEKFQSNAFSPLFSIAEPISFLLVVINVIAALQKIKTQKKKQKYKKYK